MDFYYYSETWSTFSTELNGPEIVVINDTEKRLEERSVVKSKNLNDRPPSFVCKYVLFNCSDIAFCNNTSITMELRKAVNRVIEKYGHGNGQELFEDKMQEEMKRLWDDVDKTNQLDFDIYRVIGIITFPRYDSTAEK